MGQKTVLAKLKTAHLTADYVKTQITFGEASEDDINNWLKSYQSFDGVYVYLTHSEGSEYGLMGWPEESDKKVMMAVYYMEQDSLMGTYLDDFERFKGNWDSQEYDSDAAITFPADQVEVIQVLTPKSKTREGAYASE